MDIYGSLALILHQFVSGFWWGSWSWRGRCEGLPICRYCFCFSLFSLMFGVVDFGFLILSVVVVVSMMFFPCWITLTGMIAFVFVVACG